MVKGIIDGRGCGKTKELIEFAAENKAIIVCEDPARMDAKIRGYGKFGIETMTYTEFWALETKDPNQVYCIDELEVFCDMLGIGAFTFVKE